MRKGMDCCEGQTRYWVATATHIAECPGGTGPTPHVEVTRQARSDLSLEHAEQLARQLAKTEAEAELVCFWTSTQCAPVNCEPYFSMPGYPPVCVTKTSTISQENADTLALAAAQSAAARLCS